MDAHGNIYIAEFTGNRVRKVSPEGIISTFVGTGVPGFSGDGGASISARLLNPIGVAVDAQGNLYIADSGNHRVRTVSPAGIITTVAGTGVAGFSGDGGLATAAALNQPEDVAVDGPGNLYIADYDNFRIRKVSPDGIITTVAGNGGLFSPLGDGGPARQAGVHRPSGIEVDGQGNLFIVDWFRNRIRKIGPGGLITTVAGTGTSGFSGDGGPATSAQLRNPGDVLVDPHGAVLVADEFNHRVRHVTPDGNITTAAGTGTAGFSGERGPASAAAFNRPAALAISPDGSLYVADFLNHRVRRITSILPGFTAVGDIVVASKDGSELYIFSPTGKHLRTVNALTNSLLYSFTYDNAGRLSAVTDANNNVTSIQRDANGKPTAIVGPYGQSNTLTLDANGYLASLTNAAGETTAFFYTAEGLLTGVTTPQGDSSAFTYDSKGRLLHGNDPAGGSDTLARTTIPDGYQVTHTTAENRQNTYQVEFLSTGEEWQVNTLSDGRQKQTLMGTDGSQATTLPDGMQQDLVQGPDPRFGMQAPLPAALTVSTPGGKTGTLTSARSVSLSDPSNPLSLTSQTDTATFNGRTATRTYNASTRTFTDTSPAGRQRTTTLDTQGRVVQQQQGNLTLTQFGYDSRGRLRTRTQGGRSASLSYDAQGRLTALTDPASRTVQFQYDAAGRVTRQTLPDGREITYTYDSNGNVTAIAPPGRSAHVFTYTPVNLEKDYTAPAVNDGGTQQTLYAYNADRQLTRITRPDGQTVNLNYDSAGRVSNQMLPTGQISYTYEPTTGNLKTITSPNSGTVTYSYDGSLLTNSTWVGTVSGTVSRIYDHNYSLTSQSVNGGHH